MQILKYPHPSLFIKCKPLRKVDNFIINSANEMIELMKDGGIGLSANQVGLPYMMFVTIDPKISVVINPTIYSYGGFAEKIEGCLSVPGLNLNIKRNKKVKLNGFDLKGNEINLRLDGMLARIVLHEFQHLEGKLFFDGIRDKLDIINPVLSKLISEFDTSFNNDEWESHIKSLEDDRCIISEEIIIENDVSVIKV